jgi:hypothetical protein
VTPARPPQTAATEPTAAPRAGAELLVRLLGATLALLAGLALLILPWTDSWEQNYFANLAPGWRALWMNSYFRGAVSGLGAANLYVALADLFGLRRSARAR